MFDRQTAAQRTVEEDIARAAMPDGDVRQLTTPPGVDTVVAFGVMAEIGRIDWFPSANQLSACMGLHASARQS